MTPVFKHGRLRLYLLKLLDESPRHGYDVIRDLEDRFMGLYSPSAGTVYPRLSRLEEEGLVEHSEADGRKTFSITEAGRAELRDRHSELADLEKEIAGSVRDLANEIRSDVRSSVQDLRAGLKSAARDVRRETRHHTRAARTKHGPVAVELVRATESLRAVVTEAVRSNASKGTDLAAIKAVLEQATAEVRRLVRDPKS